MRSARWQRTTLSALDRCAQRCPVLTCPVLTCPVLTCPVLTCPVLSCPVLSCPVLSRPVARRCAVGCALRRRSRVSEQARDAVARALGRRTRRWTRTR
eukprot:3047616-Rhodomonas_salina.1